MRLHRVVECTTEGRSGYYLKLNMDTLLANEPYDCHLGNLEVVHKKTWEEVDALWRAPS